MSEPDNLIRADEIDVNVTDTTLPSSDTDPVSFLTKRGVALDIQGSINKLIDRY
jgi:hypothetical protein